MPVKSIPDGYHTITPYLLVDGAAKLLTFLSKAFDASELERRLRPDGSIMHAEVRIGDSIVMMGEPVGEFGPMPASIYLYMSDCDRVYERALQVGGISVMEPTTRPAEGDRYGGVKDPCGNIWWIATHREDVSSEKQTNSENPSRVKSQVAPSTALTSSIFINQASHMEVPMSEQVTTELLKGFLEAFNRHDLDAIMGYFADDCVFYMPRGARPRGDRYVGKQEVRAGLAKRFEGIPDVHYGDDRHWACGDFGVSEWTLTGTSTSGQPIEVRGVDLLEFAQGKLIRKDSFWKILE